jgi:hypothetical protein
LSNINHQATQSSGNQRYSEADVADKIQRWFEQHPDMMPDHSGPPTQDDFFDAIKKMAEQNARSASEPPQETPTPEPSWLKKLSDAMREGKK